MAKNSFPAHPQWALKYRKPGTELRRINGRYYLYSYKTVYDPKKKRARKVSGGILGAITEEKGFIISSKKALVESKSLDISGRIRVKEFGVSSLLESRFSIYTKRLQQYFEQDWKMLAAIAYCRFAYQSPLKNIAHYLDNSFIPQMLGFAQYNEKTASGLLNKIGGDEQARLSYMRSFIKSGEYILLDGTHILSKSTQIDIVHSGYNHDKNFEGQINLLYIYSADQRIPVFYRLLPGNIRDVKAFKNTLIQAGIKKAVIIADKGFYSRGNIEQLSGEKLSFIIPMKRDNPMIDYSSIINNTFKGKGKFFQYEKRIIWHQSFEVEKYRLYLFLDDALKLREETDYISRIKNAPDGNTPEKYQQKRNTFGTIAFLCDDKQHNPQEVYENYKGRLFIENMFDGMKNILEADHTYMQDEQTLQGWLFVNHICLQWYQQLYIELKDKGLLKKISVNDYIILLKSIKKININDQWHLNEFTNATKKLLNKTGIKL